mmetsp:Transcript_5582/g.13295  ORF Transcript_5582/g.13295 Transcript_5582/m.13295 type:complete len:100 (+) Transcript_5582:507-806(+)
MLMGRNSVAFTSIDDEQTQTHTEEEKGEGGAGGGAAAGGAPKLAQYRVNVHSTENQSKLIKLIAEVGGAAAADGEGAGADGKEKEKEKLERGEGAKESA